MVPNNIIFTRLTHTVLTLALLVSAYAIASCGNPNNLESPHQAVETRQSEATPYLTRTPDLIPTSAGVRTIQVSSPTPIPNLADLPTASTSVLPEIFPTATPRPQFKVDVTWEDATLEMRYVGWKTDITKSSVPYSEIMRGGPPRDGITPVDHPVFETVSEASTHMADHEPVVSIELEGEARAYPLAILIWHELVNDELGGVPITVTYCPLCNTAIVFDRQVGADRNILDFGTTGYLRHSDMVMWDRQTESWWQQITGEAIVGEYTGAQLKVLPATLVSWQDFKDSYPNGSILSRDTQDPRNYSHPPYPGYDSIDGRPFMFYGELDDTLPSTERIVGLNVGETAIAYPFPLFEDSPVINDSIETTDIVIFYAPDTLSPFLGTFGSESPVVGSTGVYSRNLDGRELTFNSVNYSVVDEQTGSTWNIFGEAVEGPLSGSALDPVVHANHFWFAWRAFVPDTLIRSADEFAD